MSNPKNRALSRTSNSPPFWKESIFDCGLGPVISRVSPLPQPLGQLECGSLPPGKGGRSRWQLPR